MLLKGLPYFLLGVVSGGCGFWWVWFLVGVVSGGCGFWWVPFLQVLNLLSLLS